jgi:vancomycin resistance protein YoaR
MVIAGGGLLLVPVLVIVAYLVDDGGRGNQVASNVSLAGTSIQGLRGKALEDRIATIGRRVEQATIRVDAPKGGFATTAAALKLRVDVARTTKAALAVGRKGNVVSRAWAWLQAFGQDRDAPLMTRTSHDAVYAEVAAKDKGPHTPAVEPRLKLEKGAFVAVAGKDGTGIDPAAIINALDGAFEGGSPIKISVDRGRVRPRLTQAEANRLAGEAMKITADPLAVTAGTANATISTATLRNWIRPTMTDAGARLVVDPQQSSSELPKLLPGAGKPTVETRFTVSQGNVLIIDGSNGTGCCADNAPDLISNALAHRPASPLALPLKVTKPRLTPDAARKLGITERVATFTTQHPAGQPRVHNIHLIADTVQGSVIAPGDSFSINGTVGPRTLAKGYVVDHVIEDDVFAESVGGGISQFATTLFNASFFAGLDFRSYQAHTLYISRYPYGREATMGYPQPDLVIHNPSPYGILIWPSYTGTSLTVELYSTKWVDAVQSAQTTAMQGSCTRVRTERTRTYLSDHHTSVDAVFALYHPKEGVNCDGSINPKLTTTTTPGSTTSTTKPKSSTTTLPPSPPTTP